MIFEMQVNPGTPQQITATVRSTLRYRVMDLPHYQAHCVLAIRLRVGLQARQTLLASQKVCNILYANRLPQEP